MALPTLTTIPDDYGSGGKGLAPQGSHGAPALRDVLRELQGIADNDGTGLVQRGRATLVAGTVTVDTTVVLTDDSEIFVFPRERPAGSTDYAGLAVVARTSGAAGIAEFTIEAVVAAGTIDADAAFDVSWMIID